MYDGKELSKRIDVLTLIQNSLQLFYMKSKFLELFPIVVNIFAIFSHKNFQICKFSYGQYPKIIGLLMSFITFPFFLSLLSLL